tara:strand:- start:372 stop:488 length:117 start_codon:yes stop_codon:yes gene_type:complete
MEYIYEKKYDEDDDKFNKQSAKITGAAGASLARRQGFD